MAESEKLVILGASHAGVQLAVSLREAQYAGSITLLSDENHIPYHRPPLSKEFLKNEELAVQMLRAQEFYSDNDIALIKPNSAVGIDLDNRLVELDDGRKLEYSKLCIATGSRPRALDIAGTDAAQVYQLRDADDAHQVRNAAREHKSAVIIGGGFIGLEAAATLHGLGLEVVVVEAAPRLMGRAVAPEISKYVLDKLRKLGIRVYLDTPITEISTANGAVSGVVCEEKHFACDMVLIGVGVVANDELAGEAGLVVGNGIHVDEMMRTSNENVFAIGDVAAYEHWLLGGARVRLESVQNATDQARNVAANMMGNKKPYRAVPWFWSQQADMKLQMVGLSHNSQKRISRENPERQALSVFHFDDNDKLLAIDTINAPGEHMAGRKLIEAGLSPTVEQAADKDFSLKNLL
ncbi:MAG: FAD-dependent oxidoreductase [Rhizobiaceae bacterium]|nr:FAD-dependent oxidoreductase [Rhizobiaceae bacterium]